MVPLSRRSPALGPGTHRPPVVHAPELGDAGANRATSCCERRSPSEDAGRASERRRGGAALLEQCDVAPTRPYGQDKPDVGLRFCPDCDEQKVHLLSHLMNAWNAVGFLAAGLVITAFCMKDILHLRIVAVASNVAFLAYGVALGLIPVWLLHLVLLPVNLVRLWQVGGRIATDATQDRGKGRMIVRRSPGRRRIRAQTSHSACGTARTR